MLCKTILSVAALLIAAPLANAQTTTLFGGVVGDSSTLGPVIDYRSSSGTGDVQAYSISGWRVAYGREVRVTPSSRRVFSIAATPHAANNSDHIYVDGERRLDLSFQDTSLEVTFGRTDLISERWASDVRLVALYERPTAVDDEIRHFWRAPFAGARSRIGWSRITAEDPFLLTFRGTEVATTVELFAGRSLWSRIAVEQRSGMRLGSFEARERAEAMYGSGIDRVNAFLVGGSWPIAGVHTLYGYRYGEFRVSRALSATGDLSYLMRPSFAITAHVSGMRSPGLAVQGCGVDLSQMWRGVGVRIGAGVPLGDSSRRLATGYLSVFAARFMSAR